MKLDRVTGAVIAAAIVGREMLRPRPAVRDVARRLRDLPADAPSDDPITIHWDAHQIPFVVAASDGDLAVGLGIVHAHLRLAQMEIMRRVAQGRVAEMAGPLGIELDRALRLIDFPRAVPAIAAGLDPATRAWAEGFVRGVNHVLFTAPPPAEFALLGIGREAWTLADLLANARLAAADVNWLVWGRLLRARARLGPVAWRALWPRLLAGSVPNPDPPALPGLAARGGSNAAAVAGSRTASGAAMLAADPHLSIALPNIWLVAGMASPGLNVVGLMPAGFPIVAIGRNGHLAWGGTSLHHAASDLFDVAGETLAERRVDLKVRGWGRRRVTLRESALGPVVSDGMLMRHPSPLALKWVGHVPSDEMGAMLRVMRAETPDGFAAALRGFAVPGQNMLHATADGHVGHLIACASPRRRGLPADLVRPAAAASDWGSLAITPEYPDRRDPPEGFVASANDPPPPSAVPVGFLYSPADRVERLRALLGRGTIGLDDLAASQRDVQGRHATAHALAALLPDHELASVLAGWDGRYDTSSAGALAFEAVMGELAGRLPRQAELGAVAAVWQGRAMLAEAVLAMSPETLRPLLGPAMDAASALLRRHGAWGAVHVMRLRHYLGAVPLLGRRFAYGRHPAPGGNDTLDKTGHPPVRGVHAVSYGASARFLADMTAPDANRVVLLGGQDGALGSTSFADQVGLWRQGGYVDLPLRPETAALWPHRTELRPAELRRA